LSAALGLRRRCRLSCWLSRCSRCLSRSLGRLCRCRLRSRCGLGCWLSWCSRCLSGSLGRFCRCRRGFRSRCGLGCWLSWCSRCLSRSLGRFRGRSRGRRLRCRLGAIRLRVCRGSTSRNHGSDRCALRDWLGRRNYSRTPVIHRSKLLTVLCRLLSLLYLRRHWGNALLACGSEFRRHRLPRDASRPRVTGAAGRIVYGGVVDDRVRYRSLVHVNVGDGHIVHRTVVIETIPAPIPALISDASIAIPIIDAAVVTDMRAPIPVVITIPAVRISPVSWRP